MYVVTSLMMFSLRKLSIKIPSWYTWIHCDQLFSIVIIHWNKDLQNSIIHKNGIINQEAALQMRGGGSAIIYQNSFQQNFIKNCLKFRVAHMTRRILDEFKNANQI